VSSANCDIFFSTFLIEIPLILLFFLIIIAKISAQNKKIYGDKVSPCLHPRCILKDSDILPPCITADVILW
jgi:hypothetical protein